MQKSEEAPLLPGDKEESMKQQLDLRLPIVSLTFLGQFYVTGLVPWESDISADFNRRAGFASQLGGAIALFLPLGTVLAMFMVPRLGWLVSALVTVSVIAAGSILGGVSILLPALHFPWVLLAAEFIMSMGAGTKYIAKLLGVLSTTVEKRNEIFVMIQMSNEAASLARFLIPPLFTIGQGAHLAHGFITIPFIATLLISILAAAVVLVYLPNRIPMVAAKDRSVKTEGGGSGKAMSSEEKGRRIFIICLSLAMGLLKNLVTSMSNNQQVAIYRHFGDYTMLTCCLLMALPKLTNVIFLPCAQFVVSNWQITDKCVVRWMVGSAVVAAASLMFPFEDPPATGGLVPSDIIKYTVGNCIMSGLLSVANALTKSHGTKYAIEGSFFFSSESIVFLQLVFVTSLGPALGPVLGYGLSVESSVRSSVGVLCGILCAIFAMTTGLGDA